MKDLTIGGFSHDEIQAALHAKDGSRQVKFQFDILRDHICVGQLPVMEASIRYQNEDSVKRTGRFSVGDAKNIDWLTDYIKPYMLLRMPDQKTQKATAIENWGTLSQITWEKVQLFTWADLENGSISTAHREEQWVKFPLGVFVPSSPTKKHEISTGYEVEAYDLSVILREDCITDRIYYPAGTKYIAAVKALLLGAGITQVLSTDSDGIMAVDHEFEIGTSKLDIINQLLQEISYNTFSLTADGIGVLSPYEEPTGERITYTYINDALSVICPESETQMDLFSVPNVFVGIVSNPDYSKDNKTFEFFRSEYVNENPVSPLSTVRRGRRIVSVLRPKDIASQEDLDKYVRKQAFQASQVYETISFATALMPIHGENEVLRIQNADINGIYQEIGWEMDLSAGGKMTHQARRLMVI